MIARRMSNLGLNSDILHAMAFGSILASILTWRGAKKAGDTAHAERFGIFIGLWAPSFFALADLVATSEQTDRKL
jgi:hypothetical protein